MNPPSAIREAWQDVEREAALLAGRTNALSTHRRRRSMFEIFGALSKRGVISTDVAALANDLMDLHSKAVHDPNSEISTQDAIEYIELAERVAEYLNRLYRSQDDDKGYQSLNTDDN